MGLLPQLFFMCFVTSLGDQIYVSLLFQLGGMYVFYFHLRANFIPITWRTRQRKLCWILFNFLVAVPLITTHIQAPARREGTTQASRSRRADPIPPATQDLQALTISAISWHAHLISPPWPLLSLPLHGVSQPLRRYYLTYKFLVLYFLYLKLSANHWVSLQLLACCVLLHLCLKNQTTDQKLHW